MPTRTALALTLALVGGVLVTAVACTGEVTPPPDAEPAQPAEQPAAAAPAPPEGPVPALAFVQAQFETVGGKPKPRPAKMLLLRQSGDGWFREEIEDPESNVFHKAMPFDGGILTIGAEIAPKPATLKLWKRQGAGWEATTLWSRAWEGARFNRLRDVELGDLDGDGTDELIVATHDRGVVAVGFKGESGWTFTEVDETPDTFVHEIEVGDVDGDGKPEFYATPSARNRASGESQPGSVVRYDWKDGALVRSTVVDFAESHAKEILVADVNGDGTDELYVVREAHVVKEGGTTRRVDPVRIVRFAPDGAGGWKDEVVATLDDDQCRFLLAADVDHDGATELVAAGKDSGLWRLEAKDGGFETLLIDADSGGFEHATIAADLDADGKAEIYVASDKNGELRRYVWNGSSFARTVLGPVGPEGRSHITWNIAAGTF